MKRSRIHILQTTCRRCGAPVATASRSLYGMDALKAQYDRICAECMTPDEHDAMLRATVPGVMAAFQGRA